MNANDTPGLGCSGLPLIDRCAASLPDNPQCAPNYHFGNRCHRTPRLANCPGGRVCAG